MDLTKIIFDARKISLKLRRLSRRCLISKDIIIKRFLDSYYRRMFIESKESHKIQRINMLSAWKKKIKKLEI